MKAEPSYIDINQTKIDISNKDKIIFPSKNITKYDVIKYYERISKYILPHLKNRPLTMQRFPDGIKSKGFYQQEAPSYFPSWIKKASFNKKEGGEIEHVICNKKKSLVYLSNQACITPHIWLSRKSHISKPDKIVFDLDPPENTYKPVKKAALALKEVIENLGLVPFVMTTGSKGLHVIIPIIPEYDFDYVRSFARKVAERVVKTNPDIYTIEQRKNKRKGRTFIDTLSNSYGQTSVAPYAIRGLENAPVATPISWIELKNKPLNPRRYNIKNIFRRLGQKEDPWKNIYNKKVSI